MRTSVPFSRSEMQMNRFEAFEDIQGKWRWRMVAANHKVIASSGESFDSQADALRAAEGVRVGSAHSHVSLTAGLGARGALRLKALLAGDMTVGPPQPRRLVRRTRTASRPTTSTLKLPVRR